MFQSKRKVVRMLNQAPCREDISGSGGIPSGILNLGITWR